MVIFEQKFFTTAVYTPKIFQCQPPLNMAQSHTDVAGLALAESSGMAKSV